MVMSNQIWVVRHSGEAVGWARAEGVGATPPGGGPAVVGKVQASLNRGQACVAGTGAVR